MDRLLVEYRRDKFEGLLVNKNLEPELSEFIENIKSGNRKFSDYRADEIHYFASRIYELRKNNGNNAS